jgi:glycosyltransferase involved in cell wall biosynthesis
VKAQVERKSTGVVKEAAERDPRIEFLLTDQPTDEHLATFAGSDVCLTPARWEGLGLPLFEATAFGMPVITNDFPPLNEVIEDGRNGILVGNVPHGTADSGIPAYDPDIGQLTAALERIADDDVRAQLAAGAREVREERSWAATVAGIGGLIETATASKHAGSTL